MKSKWIDNMIQEFEKWDDNGLRDHDTALITQNERRDDSHDRMDADDIHFRNIENVSLNKSIDRSTALRALESVEIREHLYTVAKEHEQIDRSPGRYEGSIAG
jgi:hypothetical protein